MASPVDDPPPIRDQPVGRAVGDRCASALGEFAGNVLHHFVPVAPRPRTRTAARNSSAIDLPSGLSDDHEHARGSRSPNLVGQLAAPPRTEHHALRQRLVDELAAHAAPRYSCRLQLSQRADLVGRGQVGLADFVGEAQRPTRRRDCTARG